MGTLLAFDTATPACSAALWIDGQMTEQFQLTPRRHGHCLLPMVDALLKAANKQLSDCDALAFGQGPGSFMGLRIAAGLAQGLAFGANLPVIPISTLQALAQTTYWSEQTSPILVGWDARMQQVYWAGYQLNQGRMEPIVPDQLSFPAEIHLPSAVSGPWLAAGNAWSTYAAQLPAAITELPRSKATLYPRATAIAFLAAQQLESGGIPPESIQLSYLRNRVAEEPKLNNPLTLDCMS